MMHLHDRCGELTSIMMAKQYSTSFSMGIRMLHKPLRFPISAIYGFTRAADEIVDTFHDYDKQALLERYKKETYLAIQEGISTNPVLHSFQRIVNRYNIELDVIEAFFTSMEMDLHKSTYTPEDYNTYIYGSAEVVGLMCLSVFVNGNKEIYNDLLYGAKMLGSAFQKVNFLRDIQDDAEDKGRVYFPGVSFDNFSEEDKEIIEQDIQREFDESLEYIKRLPSSSRFGVFVAYNYYQRLFNKIKRTPASQIAIQRIRIPNTRKFTMLGRLWLFNQLGAV